MRQIVLWHVNLHWIIQYANITLTIIVSNYIQPSCLGLWTIQTASLERGKNPLQEHPGYETKPSEHFYFKQFNLALVYIVLNSSI